MAQKSRFFLGLAGLALLFFGAVFAYNALAGRVNLATGPALPEERDRAATGAEPRGRRAPDFALTDWDGNSLRFSDLVADGKPIVLNFWASWCVACRNGKPALENAFLDFGEDVKFVMLALADGVRATVETEKRYVEEGAFSFPVYFDTLQEGVRAYGIRGIPVTMFIDRNGYIVTEMHGAIGEAALRQAIEFLLS